MEQCLTMLTGVMTMLKILPFDSKSFDLGIVLGSAYNVHITREINGSNMLEFLYPGSGDKANLIQENKIVVCQGQAYRIVKTTISNGGKSEISVQCHHVYNADTPNIHIQNIPDMIGVNPYKVIEKAFDGSDFSLISEEELNKLGMTWIGSDGFLIDFFSTDKISVYEAVNAVIENCGKGEIYTDNYRFALVERIGCDSNIRLELTKNMQNISIERDITGMVTRLYPYGYNDAHIGSVNGGLQYLQSDNADIYGVKEGFRDYSDYTEPEKIMSRAMWEFNSENKERIDVPSVNITGTFADISKLSEFKDDESLNIGDGVTVLDNGNEIYERVIKIEYYPYESESTVISIGRVKKDMYFYLEQMGLLTRRYKKVSTTSGKVKAQSVSGVISNSGIKVTGSSGQVSILSDIIEITTGNMLKTKIGNSDGKFICTVFDNSGGKALELGDDGKAEFCGNLTADKINIGENVIEVNELGELCINGNVIAVTK